MVRDRNGEVKVRVRVLGFFAFVIQVMGTVRYGSTYGLFIYLSFLVLSFFSAPFAIRGSIGWCMLLIFVSCFYLSFFYGWLLSCWFVGIVLWCISYTLVGWLCLEWNSLLIVEFLKDKGVLLWERWFVFRDGARGVHGGTTVPPLLFLFYFIFKKQLL